MSIKNSLLQQEECNSEKNSDLNRVCKGPYVFDNGAVYEGV